MSWQTDVTQIVRYLINDIDSPYTYSDGRLQNSIVVAAQLVTEEIPTFSSVFTIDIGATGISPDPTDIREQAFINLISLKTACLVDSSTFRTNAVKAGISVKTGPHSISTTNQLDGYKYILENGPCKAYQDYKWDYQTGGSTVGRVILGPFAGINVDTAPWSRNDYIRRAL